MAGEQKKREEKKDLLAAAYLYMHYQCILF
jgi:hypothetical protein